MHGAPSGPSRRAGGSATPRAVDITALWSDPEIRRNLIATGILLVLAIALRTVAHRAIERAHFATEQMRLRWVVMARNVSLAFLILGGVVVWASEIQSFALSVVAIAAALVLATKELILCVSGAVLRASSGAFSVGDRVEVGAARGDVIDISLLSTTLLEVGPGHQRTGRAVTVPNSMLVSLPIVNETFMDEYVVHVVRVPIDPDRDDWEAAERALLVAAQEACAEHIEPARKFMDALSKRHGLPALSVEPRVILSMSGPKEVHMLLRIPVPARERGRMEQSVLRSYLTYLREARRDAVTATA